MHKTYYGDNVIQISAYNETHNVTLQISNYIENSVPAITAICDDGIPYGVLTVNLGISQLKGLEKNTTYILDKYYDQLLKQNIISKAIKVISYGYGYSCKAYICKINMDKFK